LIDLLEKLISLSLKIGTLSERLFVSTQFSYYLKDGIAKKLTLSAFADVFY
jgi:hypothetical protein